MRLLKTLCCLASFCTSLGIGAAAAAQTPDNGQLITIVSPQFNSTHSENSVEVGVRFAKDAIGDTFTAHLNGQDISASFQFATTCKGNQPCDKQAWLQASELRSGQNVINVDVAGPNSTAGTARLRFVYEGTSTSDANAFSHLTPAVTIHTVQLTGAASNPLNYRTIAGPGPDFPSQVYSPAGLSCSVNNGMYVLVLKRDTLALDTSVNNGKGQFCSSSASGLSTELATLSKGALVIMHSFTGNLSGLDATMIGGTKFAGLGVTPYAYNAVGVVGAPTGSAYESYRRASLNGDGALLVPLEGSLMLDIRQNYFFVPSAFRSLKVTPNDPRYPGESTIEYNGMLHRQPLPSGAYGAFWLVSLNRHTGYITDWEVETTNSGDQANNFRGYSELGYLLDVYLNSPDNLLIITTIGLPVDSPWSPKSDVVDAFNRLGGTGYLIHTLPLAKNSYTLVTSPDPDFLKGRYVIESSSAFGIPGQTGEIDGFLARGRNNLWYMHTGVTDSGLTSPMNFEWSKVAFQAPQNWPAWTVAQQNAYEDLTASSNHYPQVRDKIGCTQCAPIRSYYDGGIGTAVKPRVLSINYDQLSYYPNNNYELLDFEAVVTQLKREQSDVDNVYSVYNQFRALTNESGTIQAQLERVANNIDSSLTGGNESNELVLKRLTQASQVTTVLSAVPGIGPAFGAVTVVLDSAGALVPQYNSVPNDGRYGYTLAQLKAGAHTAGSDLADSIDSLFLGMVTDWGKMSIVGSGYANQDAPWYMCVSCNKANIPRAAVPALGLAAKQQFYLQLMPTVFAMDYSKGLPLPTAKAIGAKWKFPDGTRCYKPYDSAPSNAVQGYPHGFPSTQYDVFIITNKNRGTGIYGNQIPIYPSESLMNDVFGAPREDGSGGAGVHPMRLLPPQGYLEGREAYRGTLACTP